MSGKFQEFIYVAIAPSPTARTLPRPKTALQLLAALGLDEEGALVIRGGRLLTPDQRIEPGELIQVRITQSRG